ncbi:MAG TPA: gliding motility-associated C-terminal domain-containing protein, partial [Cyclobacteriaceae bacterium]|nr:gliding motility-associated C-terminal domain-containing protein [Cyclobacteriaceae bacterium]
TDVQGLGTVASPFTWNPDCSIFHDGVYQNQYVFRFGITDDHCFNVKGDTVALELNIKDIEDTGKPFLPTNVITPNGDNCNDYFAVEGIDPVAASIDTGCGGIINPDDQVSLPRDNCAGRFQFIRIYNRWGKQVFESTDRRFRWYAQGESAGVYYYLILFGNREFKGVLSVRP